MGRIEERVGSASDRWWLMCLLGCYRTLIKTQDYLDVFARFKQKENIEAVERMLGEHHGLARFEKSQLGTPAHT